MSISGITFALLTRKAMRTFILGWNPSKSSYGLVDFQRDFLNLEYGDFEWKLDQWQGIRSGDNFLMVKTGDGNRGIVMRGFFLSAPHPRRGGRSDVLYVDLRPTFMIHPDHPKGILPIDLLMHTMPGFRWDEDTSGRELPECCVRELEPLWRGFLSCFIPADYDNVRLGRDNRPDAGIDEAVALASEALFDKKAPDGTPLILHSLSAGLAGRTEEEIIRGFLLPVIKEKEWSVGEIREKGFSESIVDSLMSN